MEQAGHVEASLIYRAARAPLEAIDTVALRAVLNGLGAGVRGVRRHDCGVVVFDCDAFEVLVVACDVPFPPDHFRGVMRPDTDDLDTQRAVLAVLASHGSSLTVLVVDRPGVPSAGIEAKRLAAWETLDLVMAASQPDLVFWADDDRLLTAAEAEKMVQDLPEEPAADPAPNAADWDQFPPAPASRPDATIRGSRRASAWLSFDATRLMPLDEQALRAAMREFLDLREDREINSLSDTAVGRSSIFVMSATIAVFALPVGAAALAYNALSGGDARHTSHLLALTGLGAVLSAQGIPLPGALF